MVTTTLSDDVHAVLKAIVERFQPAQVMLFGSHAAGSATKESDVDVLVIMETPLRPLEQAAEISRALDHHIPVDILVRTPSQVADRHPRDLILRTILEDGIIIYEARN